MKTPVELCNDALRIMGLRTDCTNIDSNPTSQSDKVFHAFYNQTRRKMIKRVRPRFACVEDYKVLGTPVDPADPVSEIVFLKPQDCLYVQKVDGHTEFTEYGNKIMPQASCANSITINYVRDVVDTLTWSDEFDELMAAALAKKTVTYLTKDAGAKKVCNDEFNAQLAEFNALNARDTKIKKKHHALTKRVWNFPWRY
jgi:hypothetical protein